MYRIKENPTIIFDDFCVLCSRSFKYVLKHDRKEKFMFAGLSAVNDVNKLKFKATQTILLVENDIVYSKSTAFIRIMILLGGMHKIAAVLYVIPRFLRDAVYNIIARNRFKWWGKSETCFVPQIEIRNRFFEGDELAELLSAKINN